MSPTSTQIFWRLPWNSQARKALADALEAMDLCLGELSSQAIDVGSGTVGGLPVLECVFWGPAGAGWCCIHFTQGWNRAEELASALSRITGQTVLMLSDYEQTAWGFDLIHPANPVQHFVSQGHLFGGEPAPDVARMSQILGVPAERFSGYLQIQSPDVPCPQRVHPEDRFALEDAWVRVDFLRAIGIAFAGPTESALGRFCRITTRSVPAPQSPTAPPAVQVPKGSAAPWRWN